MFNTAKVFKASALVHRRQAGTGFVGGSLVDLHGADGAGAFTYALDVAARQQGASRTVVIIDGDGDFYPPAAIKLGIDVARLLVVRVRHETAVLASLDEALRSRAVAAVVARLRRLDGPSSHRLRIAAEAGGSLGLLVRPLDERSAVSAAAVRLLVRPGVAPEPFRVRGGVALPPSLDARRLGP